MSKSLVFISHIAEEREIAIAFKELIEAKFLGLINVFVSSDEHSISMGQKWLNETTNALKLCSVEVVLCSPESIKRPWINFEAGAGWIRDIPVVPLCHSGIKPTTLPLPMNLLQAATASEISSLKLIFPVLAAAIGANTPDVDFTEFVLKVKDFEMQYTFWNKCNSAFEKINAINTKIIPALRSHPRVNLELTETQIGKLEELVVFLKENEVLQFQRTGSSVINTGGTFYGCSLIPLSKLAVTLNDPKFIYH